MHIEYLSANVISIDLSFDGNFLTVLIVSSPPQIILMSETLEKYALIRSECLYDNIQNLYFFYH